MEIAMATLQLSLVAGIVGILAYRFIEVFKTKKQEAY